MGLANYYRKFVGHFSTVAASLTTLCSPRARFTWGDAKQRSFRVGALSAHFRPLCCACRTLRSRRACLPTLQSSPFTAILEQPDDAGAFHPVAFASRKLTPPELSYLPHLLDLLGVVHALKTLRPYLDKIFELEPANATAAAAPRQSQPGSLAQLAGRVLPTAPHARLRDLPFRWPSLVQVVVVFVPTFVLD